MNPAWVAFWGGLAGAVIGAAASAVTTLIVLRDERKRRTEEREHEDRTRFHRERVQFYAEFQSAAAQLFTHHLAVKGGAIVAPDRFASLLERVTETEARVSYVAAPSVSVVAANLVNVLAVEEGLANEVKYALLLGEFKLAARNELGVNPANDLSE